MMKGKPCHNIVFIFLLHDNIGRRGQSVKRVTLVYLKYILSCSEENPPAPLGTTAVPLGETMLPQRSTTVPPGTTTMPQGSSVSP